MRSTSTDDFFPSLCCRHVYIHICLFVKHSMHMVRIPLTSSLELRRIRRFYLIITEEWRTTFHCCATCWPKRCSTLAFSPPTTCQRPTPMGSRESASTTGRSRRQNAISGYPAFVWIWTLFSEIKHGLEIKWELWEFEKEKIVSGCKESFTEICIFWCYTNAYTYMYLSLSEADGGGKTRCLSAG